MGINLGLCGYNGHDGQMPEMYTSLLYLGVNAWVRDMSSPYRDRSFCSDINNENPPEGGAVSIYIVGLLETFCLFSLLIYYLFHSKILFSDF